MPRPTKCRRVEFFPQNTSFIPDDNNKVNENTAVILKLEELEALRLKDLKGLNQEQCAKSMQVSRQTFQNIIDSARYKTAEALTEGKGLIISGGHYKTNACELKCLDCGNEYTLKYTTDRKNCPKCGSSKVICKARQHRCHQWCQSKKNDKNT